LFIFDQFIKLFAFFMLNFFMLNYFHCFWTFYSIFYLKSNDINSIYNPNPNLKIYTCRSLSSESFLILLLSDMNFLFSFYFSSSFFFSLLLLFCSFFFYSFSTFFLDSFSTFFFDSFSTFFLAVESSLY